MSYERFWIVFYKSDKIHGWIYRKTESGPVDLKGVQKTIRLELGDDLADVEITNFKELSEPDFKAMMKMDYT